MFTFIYGPQASGKTTIAKNAEREAAKNRLPAPLIIDPLEGPLDNRMISIIISRQSMGLATIVVSQREPDDIIKKLKPAIINLQDFQEVQK
jgi:hypothetical protein